jgi:hypothetical protein
MCLIVVANKIENCVFVFCFIISRKFVDISILNILVTIVFVVVVCVECNFNGWNVLFGGN